MIAMSITELQVSCMWSTAVLLEEQHGWLKKCRTGKPSVQIWLDWSVYFLFLLDRANANPTWLISMQSIWCSADVFAIVGKHIYKKSRGFCFFKNLLSDLKKEEAQNSSCDCTNIEQLSVFKWYFDGKTFWDELLYFLPVPGCRKSL